MDDFKRKARGGAYREIAALMHGIGAEGMKPKPEEAAPEAMAEEIAPQEELPSEGGELGDIDPELLKAKLLELCGEG